MNVCRLRSFIVWPRSCRERLLLGQHRGHGAHREVELAVHPEVAPLEGEPEQDLGPVGGDPARRRNGAGCSLLLRGRLIKLSLMLSRTL